MNKPNGSGLSRIAKAGMCSIQGLKAVYTNEAAFRQELLGAMVLTPLAFWLGKTPLGVSLMLATLVLVLLVEVLNSAIEAIVDRIGLEQHELSGRAKDMGSLAVTLAIIVGGIVWLGVILGNY
jgi:diacylglycerol kinase (ATP)